MVTPSILPSRVSARQPICKNIRVFLVGTLFIGSVSNFVLLRRGSEEMKAQNESVGMRQELEALRQHGAATETTATRSRSVLPDGYDVLDVGSSKGKGSINFLHQAVTELRFVETDTAKRLDVRTLGLDYDQKKVDQCNLANKDSRNDCLLFNILTETPQALKQSRTISGNSYWHVLEHIPDCHMAHNMWTKAAAFSQRFSSFHGPAFDDELVAYNVKPSGPHRFWEHWSGHKCHFNSTHLENAIRAVPKTRSFVVINYGKIETTASKIIVPADTPENSHHYDQSSMPAKDIVPLVPPRYEEMRACAVYDNIGHMSLYAALCLRDAFSAPSRLAKLSHLVRACAIHGEDFVTIEDCARMLQARALETIERFQKLPASEILRTI